MIDSAESPTSSKLNDLENETTWSATWNATVAEDPDQNDNNKSGSAVESIIDPVAGMSDDAIEAMIRRKFESAETAWKDAKEAEAMPPPRQMNPIVKFVLDVQESDREIKAEIAKRSLAKKQAFKFAAAPIRNASRYELLQLELAEADNLL
mmetsp:Transcript_21560/g.31893  ORF Transcript_21560/g.31893 Transcript_21560/m.31893 type:complete len:151 (-) Transcript_21560:147-599(-)|eukprot:CAMPEP_0194215168 /NCGR_PEP_ID=MMETSP0156-20130528/16761_1 /TAXON_ID=33649 /ORGANISM="Thalassionema nitzschioides, Strain L26-B" /LENGTH=150 /DNA_ID=CAMNT_0038943607 /DNA_START=27 /DNA_END=479 /DNA_ORIENTATION=-